jgi:hypothetical protein
MERYKDFQPTGCDPKGLGLPNKQDWFVVPVIQTRDSGVLAEANFKSALDMLGGEQADLVEVHRFGHWGPGWFEIIIIHPSLEAKGKEIEESLEAYPILDDDLFSQMEYDAVYECWDNMSLREKIDLHKELGENFLLARHEDIRSDRVYEKIRSWVEF